MVDDCRKLSGEEGSQVDSSCKGREDRVGKKRIGVIIGDRVTTVDGVPNMQEFD